MNTPSLLVLVRHGFSLANELRIRDGYYISERDAGKIEGLADHEIPLTEIGRSQATMTGPFLRDKYGVFDVVYDSGYVRAAQTRQALLKAYPTTELSEMELRESYLIRERERGYTFAMTEAEASKYFAWAQRHYEINGHFYTRAPGGQSHADMCQQVELFLRKTNEEWCGKKMLVVTHGHTIRAIRFVLEGWTAAQYDEMMKKKSIEVPNCSVTAYRFSKPFKGLALAYANKVYWQEISAKASVT